MAETDDTLGEDGASFLVTEPLRRAIGERYLSYALSTLVKRGLPAARARRRRPGRGRRDLPRARAAPPRDRRALPELCAVHHREPGAARRARRAQARASPHPVRHARVAPFAH